MELVSIYYVLLYIYIHIIVACHDTAIVASRSAGGGCAADWAATTPNPSSIEGQVFAPNRPNCSPAMLYQVGKS